MVKWTEIFIFHQTFQLTHFIFNLKPAWFPIRNVCLIKSMKNIEHKVARLLPIRCFIDFFKTKQGLNLWNTFI